MHELSCRPKFSAHAAHVQRVNMFFFPCLCVLLSGSAFYTQLQSPASPASPAKQNYIPTTDSFSPEIQPSPPTASPPSMAGRKRSYSSTTNCTDATTVAAANSSDQTPEPPQREEDESRQFSTDELIPALSLAASAISLALHFLSDENGSDLLLLPSQTLTLESSVHSAAVSLTRLLALLRISPKSLNLPSPSPTRSPPSSPKPSWFLRFLSSSSSSSFGDPRWSEYFRMSKPSFYLLLQTLAPSINSYSSATSTAASGVVPIPADHKLGAALFRLAHGAPFRAVAHRFGLSSPDLACRVFYEVCKAVADQLGHLFELSSDFTRVLQGFHWMSLPNCCGALGFSRFGAGTAVIAQALVDSEGRFLDVSAGWRASMSPAEILPRTKLHSSQAVVLAGGPPLQLSGVGSSLPRYFLGGTCCPLLPWLLTPYCGEELSCTAAVYNSVHARGMALVLKAFSRVRSRWKLLRGEWKEECVEALPFVIVASCLLHNYLMKCSEPVPDVSELGMEVEEDGFPEFKGKKDKVGERIRGALASHLSKVIINP